MATVDIYCRVSTDPQEDNSSLDEQEAAGRAYCEANGLLVGMVHREVFSGYQYREREKLDLMRQRYRDGSIQGVVIRTLDRLSRSQVHNAILMEEMEHHNATLYCVKEAIDDTPMGKFIRMVLAFVAEMEREKIMDRTTTGRINRAKEGKIVSGNKAPYGWQWQYDETGDKKVILHDEETAILRWMAEQYAEGVAAHSLRNQLNARGIPSPSGSAWNDMSIIRMLSDQRLTGKNAKIFAYQNRITKQPLAPIDLPDGTYPAIISEELFEVIQRRRETNKADAIRASKEPLEYLLRAGFVKCAYCNKAMAAVRHRKQYTYRCVHNEGGHTNVILAKTLDALIWQWMEKLADHVSIIEQAVALATNSNTLPQEIAAIEQSIKTWQTKAANYLADLDDNTLIDDSRAAIRAEMNKANRMVLQLEHERSQLKTGMIDREKEQAAYQDILNWCRKVKESREELTYQRKRDFLRMLGVVVVIENIKPFYEHTVYHVEIALPAIQELIAPHTWVNCDSPSGEGVGSPLG